MAKQNQDKTKNCVFQYATSDGVIYYDTDLITEEEANELFNDKLPDFIEKIEKGLCPEMAIWVDMDENFRFVKTSRHIYADDLLLKDGELYELVKIS